MKSYMKEKGLESMTKEEARKAGLVLGWLSSKVGSMTETLHAIHQDNQRFLSEFYQKQQAIDRQIYELRGRSYQTHSA